MSTIEYKNVKKSYGPVHIIHNFDISIDSGEFIVLVGPSGCGKSTLMRMLAGLESISSGEILIDGKVINNIEPKDRGIGFVFQDYALYPHMSVRQNMSFALENAKMSASEIEERVNEAADFLQLSQLLERYPKELSGGQQQRVALGRAIVRRPKVFLMDEPLSNLDAKLRFHMRRLIKRIQQKFDITCLYVTHDQEEAMALGDRIVVLEGGYAQQIGKPYELFKNPVNQFVAGFIGLPAMSFLEVAVSGTSNEIQLTNTDIDIPIRIPKHVELLQRYIGKSINLGIRSDSVKHNIEHTGQIKGEIELIEIMGAESLVFMKTGSNEFSVRLETASLEKAGDKVGGNITLDIIEEKIHVFDLDTQSCLF
jgi:sn-glycerol 3-phosphate transport system ATP-binding protein